QTPCDRQVLTAAKQLPFASTRTVYRTGTDGHIRLYTRTATLSCTLGLVLFQASAGLKRFKAQAS
ncbi:MAG TPA: hypothetical protein VI431_18525, partial [Candidatus Acidoferrum sp.]